MLPIFRRKFTMDTFQRREFSFFQNHFHNTRQPPLAPRHLRQVKLNNFRKRGEKQ